MACIPTTSDVVTSVPLLPSTTHSEEQRSIQLVLANLGCSYDKPTTVVSTCFKKGPCNTHPERGDHCNNAKGISYNVLNGLLKGTWCAWGDDAEDKILCSMLDSLEKIWNERMTDVRKIGKTLRGGGR